jgi:hypothetical protein
MRREEAVSSGLVRVICRNDARASFWRIGPTRVRKAGVASKRYVRVLREAESLRARYGPKMRPGKVRRSRGVDERGERRSIADWYRENET